MIQKAGTSEQSDADAEIAFREALLTVAKRARDSNTRIVSWDHAAGKIKYLDPSEVEATVMRLREQSASG